jgi:type IV secretion system protein VirB10
MALDHQMAPDASPDRVTLRTGVRRANKMPLVIGAAVLGLILTVVVIVANQRAAQQQAILTTQLGQPPIGQSKGATSFAQQIIGGRQNGMIPAAPTKPTVPATSPSGSSEPVLMDERLRFAGELSKTNLLLARPDLDDPPKPGGPLMPAHQLQAPQSVRGEETDPIKVAKLQLFQDALRAPSTVSFTLARGGAGLSSDPISAASETARPSGADDPRTRLAQARHQLATAGRSDDPTKAYQTQLAELRKAGMLGPDGGADATPGGGSSGMSGKSLLSSATTSASGDRWKHEEEQKPPRADFLVQAGDVLPALVISEINSSQPGQILAQVSQNVYDTPTKTHLLIPQGTKLVGTYSSDVGYGQQVLLVAWQRLSYPDGKTLDIGSMPGATGPGASGLTDLVDNHYLRVFGSALLMSAVTAGITFSQQQSQGVGTAGQVGIPQYNAGTAMSQALGNQLGQVTAQLIAKNLNIAPELRIRPGYRFNVVVVKDLTFPRPYEQFDY